MPYDIRLKKYILQNKDKYYTDELVKLIFEKFNRNISTKTLRKYFYRHNLTFKKKYNRKDKCVFAKPIGYESKPDKNGLIKIKINKKQWQYKQRYLYEKYNKVKVPDDYLVIFLDGNKNNFSKENLYAVPKKEAQTFYILMKENKIKDSEFTKIGLQIAKIKNIIKEKGELL